MTTLMNGPRQIVLVVPSGTRGMTPNREGAAGMGAVADAEGGFRYPPQTLATVAAKLLEQGYRVTLVDAVALGLDSAQCSEAILEASPDLVGLYVSWATRDIDGDYLRELKSKLVGQVPIVALGSSTRFMLSDLAQADRVLLGEPELSFSVLCDIYFSDQAALAHVVSPVDLNLPGYDGEGHLLDLDQLPMPAWDLLPLEAYPFMTVLSSRGCGSGCSWCPYTVAQGRHFRATSPERTVRELRALISRYHPRRIVFRDPVFAYDAERVERLCRLLLADEVLKPGANLYWECETRPDHLDPWLLRFMSLAGCVAIKLGLETTAGHILLGQGRVAAPPEVQAYLATTRKVVRLCRRLGIAARLYCLVGLPGQTAADLEETATWIETNRPASLTVKQVHAYPEALSDGVIQEASVDLQAGLDRLLRAGDALAHASFCAPRWRQRMERALTRGAVTVGRLASRRK